MNKVAILAAILLATPAFAQDNAITLKGAVDIHVHQDPDSAPRAIDADDVARQAKAAGMRAVVLKNHWEDTASLAYMVRKMVPGVEVFGGITQDIAVGGINIEAVKHMADMKGGYGRIVWLPTFDAQNQVKGKGPEVKVSENGKLLPSVLALLDYIATRKQLVLETGHVSAEEALMVINEARARGIAHVVATHGMAGPTNLSVAQAQEAGRMGAYIEFVYGGTLEKGSTLTVAKYAEWIKAVGPTHCIISSDLGGARPYPRPMPTAGLLEFMNALHKEGLSVADINLMVKTNPSRILGLEP
ncbi:MAG: hypothetical protein H0U98_12350 [Alphaproteobacteria bacterium]|nr:hypothetical protein [Alphaproteobacteria bacterium]